MRSLLALAVMCSSLAAAVPAAAVPFTPSSEGTGAGPDLAVTPNGAAHVVWLNDAGADHVRYCRVPPGASACDSESGPLSFPSGGTSAVGVGEPKVFATGGTNLTIVASCSQCPSGQVDTKAFRWTSTDNGANFTPSAQIGNIGPNGQAGRLGTLELILAGSTFQAMPAGATSPVNLGGGAFSPAVVGDPAGQKAVYATTNSGVVSYRIFQDDAAPTTAGELNFVGVGTKWGALQTLSSPEGNNVETHLSSGSRGTVLSYLFGDPGADGVRMRTLDGTNTFGGPTNVQGSDPIDRSSDLPHHSQEGSRIHFVWRTLYDGNRLRYTCSAAGGQAFSTPATLAAGESFLDPVVQGAGTCGKGFAAWQNQSGAIRVAALEPVAESTPPPGGPGSGSPGGGSGPGSGSAPSPAISDFGIASPTLAPGQGTSFTFTSDRAGTAVLTIEKRAKGLKVKKAGVTRCVLRTRKRVRKVRRQLARRADVRRLSGRARRRRIARLLRKRRCTLYRKLGEIRQEVVAGRNTIVFTGTLAGRPLGPGTYRATLVVTDTAGNVSRTETVTFRVQRAGSR